MKIFKRFDLLMAIVAIVCVALMAGCGKATDKGEKADEADEEKTEIAKVDDDLADEEAEDEDEEMGDEADEEEMPDAFGTMIGKLNKTPVTVSPKGAKANIEDFARSFASKYHGYEPNDEMLKYLANPKAFNEEAEVYSVKSDVANGYISSCLLTEIDRFTKMCYWNRKDGHSLVGAFMINGHEGEEVDGQSAFIFYDYDPETNIMTPDIDVCKAVAKVAHDKHFDDYALELPAKGKDITVKLYSDNGEDGYDITEKLLKWNGHSFTPAAK